MDESKFAPIVKQLEGKWEDVLPRDQPFVIRLDGHGFSKYTKAFEKPIDARIKMCMVNTMMDVLQTLQGSLGYTQSDEITLVFLPKKQKVTNLPAPKNSTKNLSEEVKLSLTGQPVYCEPIYSGRVQKLASLAAGRASAVFNREMTKLKSDAALAYFDARVFSCTYEEAVAAVFWRTQDAYVNGVAVAAQSVFKHQELHGKNTQEMLDMYRQKKDASLLDPHLFFGTFGCKELVTKSGFNPVSQSSVPVERMVYRSKTWTDAITWTDVQDLLK